MDPKNAEMQINDLGQRIDAASDDGDTAALESLDAECAGLLGLAGPHDALLHYFRSNVQDVERHANDELRRQPVLRSVAFGQEVPEQKNSGAVNGPDRQRGSYDNQGFG